MLCGSLHMMKAVKRLPKGWIGDARLENLEVYAKHITALQFLVQAVISIEVTDFVRVSLKRSEHQKLATFII
jgi:hypothetical protein